MYPLSKEQLEQSRSIQVQILQSAAKYKRGQLAQGIGVDTTTVGRWLDSSHKDSKLMQFAAILAMCDLKVVPADMKCYDIQKIDILFRLAKNSFDRLDAAEDFFIPRITNQGEHHE